MRDEGGMRSEDLNSLLLSESESVEWKRSLGEWKEIVVSVAATVKNYLSVRHETEGGTFRFFTSVWYVIGVRE